MTAPWSAPPSGPAATHLGVPEGADHLQGGVWPPPEEPVHVGLWRKHGADVRAALVCVVALVLLGAPLGLLWAHTAPHVDVAKALDAPESSFRALIDGDMLFLLLSSVVGLAAGALGWRYGRRTGVGVAIGLVAGGVLCALVAARVGMLARLHEYDRFAGELSQLGLDLVRFRLRATQELLALPFLAVVLLGALLLLVDDRRPGEPAPEPAAQPDAAAPSAWWSAPAELGGTSSR